MTTVISHPQEISTDNEDIATLDLGGTLTKRGELGGSLQEINTEFLDKETEGHIYKDHINTEKHDHIGHAQELNRYIAAEDETPTVEDYIEAVQKILDDRELIEGAETAVNQLNNSGYTTVTISSQPTEISALFASKLAVDYDMRWKQYSFKEDGELKGFYVNRLAKEGKQGFIEELQNLGYTVTHIGNGSNDLKAAKQANQIFLGDWHKPGSSYKEILEAT